MRLQLPTLVGRIERRLLVNFRADPSAVANILPAPFTPQVVRGSAIVGICIIRLADARPAGTPARMGITAEHVAHRIAVNLPAEPAATGVFIPRRDTSSPLVAAIGSHFFSGGLRRARCEVVEHGGHYSFALESADKLTNVVVEGGVTDQLPRTSVFAGLNESSLFFQKGAVGYSAGAKTCQFDGVLLETERWEVRSLAVTRIRSAYFDDPLRFPPGSVEFDHALVMRDIDSRWTALPTLVRQPAPRVPAA
jgi:hypothetical protein